MEKDDVKKFARLVNQILHGHVTYDDATDFKKLFDLVEDRNISEILDDEFFIQEAKKKEPPMWENIKISEEGDDLLEDEFLEDVAFSDIFNDPPKKRKRKEPKEYLKVTSPEMHALINIEDGFKVYNITQNCFMTYSKSRDTWLAFDEDFIVGDQEHEDKENEEDIIIGGCNFIERNENLF